MSICSMSSLDTPWSAPMRRPRSRFAAIHVVLAEGIKGLPGSLLTAACFTNSACTSGTQGTHSARVFSVSSADLYYLGFKVFLIKNSLQVATLLNNRSQQGNSISLPHTMLSTQQGGSDQALKSKRIITEFE